MYIKFRSFFKGIALFFFSAMVVVACQKGDFSRSESSSLKVYLTDHPAEYDQVLVQITAVEAKVDSARAHCKDDDHGDRPDHMDFDGDDHRSRSDEFGFWQTLDFKPGSYDLLTLRNGVDTLIGSGTINGTLRKVRISISSATVVKNGVSYPVILSGATPNYLYVRMHDRHMDRSSDSSKVCVDFDIARSIREINGKFYLNPVLKPFNDRNFAGLEGNVTPAEAGVLITAYNAADTATAIPDARGRYCIRGLEAGTYTILFDANNGYADQTLTGIQLTNGRRTKVADVVLKK
jgi:hypothetical protein